MRFSSVHELEFLCTLIPPHLEEALYQRIALPKGRNRVIGKLGAWFWLGIKHEDYRRRYGMQLPDAFYGFDAVK